MLCCDTKPALNKANEIKVMETVKMINHVWDVLLGKIHPIFVDSRRQIVWAISYPVLLSHYFLSM